MSKFQQKEIENITKRIAKRYKPEKIFLFGSFAWGKPNKDSDVDLLIIKRTRESLRELARKIDQSLFERNLPLDILVYSPEYFEKRLSLGDPFTKKIADKGKVLYETEK